MLFNSLGYLALLALAVPLHWLLPHGRLRMAFLAAVSFAFYAMWRPDFALLVVFSAGVDFVAARAIAATEVQARRRVWLALSLCVNLGLLVFFKYSYFLWDNLRAVTALAGGELPGLRELGLEILLPLGISFYTFQTISYTIDVYRRVARPEPDFVAFLTYVMFWPQLIAGPVLRVGEVLPQLLARRRPQARMIADGLLLIVTGLFKKVVLADSLAPMVDEAFALPAESLTALDTWVATVLFGFQIYLDFAGYSDIAIGSALLVGLRFPENFSWPYMAASPREFWTRWHISLSSWIRDYLYLPLAGERFRTKSAGGIGVAADTAPGAPASASPGASGGAPAESAPQDTARRARRRNLALLATWFIMGLWHGAAWSFALWGLYHAALILIYRVVPLLRTLPERHPVGARLLMFPLAMAAWIPFRAGSLEQALALLGRLVTPSAYTLSGRQVDMYSWFWAAAFTAGLVAAWLLARRLETSPRRGLLAAPVLTAAVAVMVAAVLLTLRTVQQFIYFQF